VLLLVLAKTDDFTTYKTLIISDFKKTIQYVKEQGVNIRFVCVNYAKNRYCNKRNYFNKSNF